MSIRFQLSQLRAAVKGGLKALVLSLCVMLPGFVLSLKGYAGIGMVFIMLGSFLLMASSFRRPWRIGVVSCALPAMTAAFCYCLQLWLFRWVGLSYPLVFVAGLVGAMVGVLRGRAHEVYQQRGVAMAQRSYAYLVVWAFSILGTQTLGLVARDVFAVRGGLVTGAFSTAMLGVVSLMLLNRRSRVLREARVATLIVLGLVFGGQVLPASAEDSVEGKYRLSIDLGKGLKEVPWGCYFREYPDGKAAITLDIPDVGADGDFPRSVVLELRSGSIGSMSGGHYVFRDGGAAGLAKTFMMMARGVGEAAGEAAAGAFGLDEDEDEKEDKPTPLPRLHSSSYLSVMVRSGDQLEMVLKVSGSIDGTEMNKEMRMAGRRTGAVDRSESQLGWPKVEEKPPNTGSALSPGFEPYTFGPGEPGSSQPDSRNDPGREPGRDEGLPMAERLPETNHGDSDSSGYQGRVRGQPVIGSRASPREAAVIAAVIAAAMAAAGLGVSVTQAVAEAISQSAQSSGSEDPNATRTVVLTGAEAEAVLRGGTGSLVDLPESERFDLYGDGPEGQRVREGDFGPRGRVTEIGIVARDENGVPTVSVEVGRPPATPPPIPPKQPPVESALDPEFEPYTFGPDEGETSPPQPEPGSVIKVPESARVPLDPDQWRENNNRFDNAREATEAATSMVPDPVYDQIDALMEKVANQGGATQEDIEAMDALGRQEAGRLIARGESDQQEAERHQTAVTATEAVTMLGLGAVGGGALTGFAVGMGATGGAASAFGSGATGGYFTFLDEAWRGSSLGQIAAQTANSTFWGALGGRYGGNSRLGQFGSGFGAAYGESISRDTIRGKDVDWDAAKDSGLMGGAMNVGQSVVSDGIARVRGDANLGVRDAPLETGRPAPDRTPQVEVDIDLSNSPHQASGRAGEGAGTPPTPAEGAGVLGNQPRPSTGETSTAPSLDEGGWGVRSDSTPETSGPRTEPTGSSQGSADSSPGPSVGSEPSPRPVVSDAEIEFLPRDELSAAMSTSEGSDPDIQFLQPEEGSGAFPGQHSEVTYEDLFGLKGGGGGGGEPPLSSPSRGADPPIQTPGSSESSSPLTFRSGAGEAEILQAPRGDSGSAHDQTIPGHIDRARAGEEPIPADNITDNTGQAWRERDQRLGEARELVPDPGISVPRNAERMVENLTPELRTLDQRIREAWRQSGGGTEIHSRVKFEHAMKDAGIPPGDLDRWVRDVFNVYRPGPDAGPPPADTIVR